jgi:DNA-binding LacI/PurR family transcriptional regulator
LDHIHQEKWRANDRIPSENELANQFQVSRITIKNALSKLMEEGIIYRIQGKGSFVSPNQSGEPVAYKASAAFPDKLVAYLMPRLDNLFSANLLNGIENQLAKDGYHLLFCKTHNQKENEIEALRKMIQLQVKGIIIFPVNGESYNEEILKLTLNGFPVVVVDRYLRGVETNCVCSDNVTGTIEAVKHLLELGHRQIGFVSTNGEGTSSIEDRLSGYEKALAEHNLPVDHQLRLMNLDPVKVNTVFKQGGGDEASKEAIKAYLKQNPAMTAVITVNSSVGLTLIEAAEELSIRIPDDLSVVFLDDYELSSYSRIPPTCINQEESTVGREAAKLLVSIINNPMQERRKILTPTRIVVRGSTAHAKTSGNE